MEVPWQLTLCSWCQCVDAKTSVGLQRNEIFCGTITISEYITVSWYSQYTVLNKCYKFYYIKS